LKTAAPQQDAEDEAQDGMQPKKKNNTLIIIGGIAGGVIIIVLLIIAFSGNNEDRPNGVVAGGALNQTNINQEIEEEPEPVFEESPITKPPVVEIRKTVKKKKKDRLEIDEELKAEIMPILEALPKQGTEDFNTNKQLIKSKGKKVIPILIRAIRHEDKQVARYSSDILKEMTRWSDAPNVNPMVGSDRLKDFSLDWEDWWIENKDSIAD